MPTHTGRAGTLDELLERIGREPGADEIEVCVSDNASQDETQAVIGRHRKRFGARLRYARNEHDLGLGENFMRLLELASSDYCWLMGSDDAPARGSLKRVLSLIEEHDGATGLILGHVKVAADDLDTPGFVVEPEAYPPQRVTTRLRDLTDVTQSLGYLMWFTSVHVVSRRRWQAVVDAERREALAAANGIHVYITGRMTARDPDWVWCPEPLVLLREAPTYLQDADGLGLRPAATLRRMLLDLDRALARLHGRRSYGYRAVMYKAMRHLWDAENLFGMRIHSPGARDYVANIACVRHFWWSRWFWRHGIPRLLMPVGPLRPGTKSPRWGATSPLDPNEVSVRVEGSLPETMTAGYSSRVKVRLTNDSSRPLSSAEPFPVRVAPRWENAETGLGVKLEAGGSALWPPLRAGHARTVEVTLRPPREARLYRLSVSVHQMRVGWGDVERPENALRGWVQVEPMEISSPASSVAASPR